IPPHPKIHGKPGVWTPIVLDVGTNLRVVCRQAWRAALDNQFVRIGVLEDLDPPAVDRVAVHKLRRIAVPLVDRVTHEVDCRAALEDVVTTRMPACIGKIVTQSDPALDEVLDGEVAADLCASPSPFKDPVDDSGRVW